MDKSKNEKFAEKWLTENGFIFKISKQYVSKTKYEVSKDGISDNFEISNETIEPEKFMKMYNKSF